MQDLKHPGSSTHHHPPPKAEHAHEHEASGSKDARTRPAESGGFACQLDLAVVLPGEADDARFEKLEKLLTAKHGIEEVHLRRDLGRVEVCIHYDCERVTLARVYALVQAVGAKVADRYRQKTWFVRGMDCAQCGQVIEHSLARRAGVLSASVAYAAERLVVAYDRQGVSLKDIEARVDALGYTLESPEHGHACSHHAHGGGLAPRWELPLAILSGVFLLLGLLLSWALPIPTPLPPFGLSTLTSYLPTLCYALAICAGGLFATRDALGSLRQLRFDIETLMVLAALSAALLGAWFEGAFLLSLFSLGHAFEHRALERARRAIEALGQLRPSTALVQRGAEETPTLVQEVRRGDLILVRPGDRVPLDGVIRAGEGSLDQSAITGESLPAPKEPGDDVFCGTLNLDAALTVEVTRLSNESVLARVVDMVTEAEAQKSPTQRFTQKLEQRFVPLVLLGAILLPVLLFFFWEVPLKDALLRSVVLLVAASPCALAISTPSAVLSAVAAAARGGVLIKGGAHLETLGKIRTIAFDKTGTLTEGKPSLISVHPAKGVTEASLLATAAGVERLSSHPLARAVVQGAKERGITPESASGCQAMHGRGLFSQIGEERIAVGSLALFEGEEVPSPIRERVRTLEAEGQTSIVVRRGGGFLGVLGVADTVRPEAKAALSSLKELGIVKTLMLSGDHAQVAEAIGAELGIDELRAPLLPEEKVAVMRDLAEKGEVVMVGDGVNDAPALAAASVGIAMGGAGSDVALETADIVLMGDDLQKLPFVIGLARKATRIIQQNLIVSLGVSALLIVASLFGFAQISEAVIFHEGSTLLVVANALRLLRYR